MPDIPGTLPRLSQEIYAHPVQKRNIHFQNWPFIGTMNQYGSLGEHKRHLMADDVKVCFRGTIIYVQAYLLDDFHAGILSLSRVITQSFRPCCIGKAKQTAILKSVIDGFGWR